VYCCCLQLEVQNAEDVVALMARGASQRATSETKMNDRSSRSHQILTVIVDGFNTVTKAASHGCLHLIDLAGSERVGKSEASGTTTGYITRVTVSLRAQCTQPCFRSDSCRLHQHSMSCTAAWPACTQQGLTYQSTTLFVLCMWWLTQGPFINYVC
jgi:hypothetical protein